MVAKPNRTPLYDWHRSRDANMANFRGWDMPLWYSTGAVAEHLAVISAAGVFDTSHMSAVVVAGPDAQELLQACFTRDLRSLGKRRSPLVSGTCVFGAFLDEQGHLVDDTVLYHLDRDSYMAVVNAGKGAEVASHLECHQGGLNVQLTDLTASLGKIDLQGPQSAAILQRVLMDPYQTLSDMGHFSFKGHFDPASPLANVFTSGGVPIMISRTGFTGELGFELFMPADRLKEVWDAILTGGAGSGLIPCGLAARDSLRAGAVLPLSGQDMGPWPFINHPWHFALPFNEDGTAFTKRFVGEVVIEKRSQAHHTLPFVGYDPRKVSVHDPAIVKDHAGTEIGVVLTCVGDMAIDRYKDRVFSIASPDKPENFKPRGLACGFVLVKEKLPVGSIVELKDNKRSIKAVIVNDIRPDRTAGNPMRLMLPL